MNPRYAPTTPEGRLSRLAEEIGEVMIEAGKVLRLIGKAQRFGVESRPPGGGPTNVEALLAAHGPLMFELEDLRQAAELVYDDLHEMALPAVEVA